MSHRDCYFQYSFFPVGQGLFSAGCIHQVDNSVPVFQWVYDCGTLSPQRLLDQGLEFWQWPHGGDQPLNLVAISHFDKDHVSGICKLISKYRVDTLLLPYLPLWKRLLIAFEEGVGPQAGLMHFFLNPAAYLAGQDGANIGRILFVLPSGDEGPPIPEGTPRDPHDEPEKSGMDFDPGKPDDPDEVGLLMLPDGGPEVRFLRSGGAISFSRLWEFVPYNDDAPAPVTNEFLQAAANVRDQLLDGTGKKGRSSALKQLKRLYDVQFGTSAENRNVISLFLYSGPVYANWTNMGLSHPGEVFHGQFWVTVPDNPSQFGQRGLRCSALYTGDGYLNAPAKLDKLMHYLRAERMTRVAVLQVMHHGAEGNWHPGLAGQIAPEISVFSSDPRRRPFHPHARVLEDFRNYRPIQVDKRSGTAITGWLTRR